MRIGLTGGIASGKSTVSDILASLGIVIIDADKIAHELMAPQEELWQKVVAAFGEEILKEDNKINRSKLGEIIFNNPEEKKRLDQLTHPAIISELKERIKKREKDHKLVVAEIPLLIEAGILDFFAEVWLVYVNRAVQLKRLMARDGIDREAAQKKIEAQMPLDKKRKYADRIIDNNGSHAELKEEIKQILVGVEECDY